ncbi:LysR substrate-binding domain-containing protein [Photobacterium makurazakiensis]|uniref:LysR substrate-binding domain-containing protein n=1 Tax=Photobacterium makurazakiensis TaxID=2910234 RepID=UPI003D0C950D
MTQNVNDMVIFARVVQAGGFTAAAEMIGLPKSNISRHVSSLEESLGIRLLERTTRRIHLTDIGQIYYQHCVRIIEESEHAEQAVLAMMSEPQGVLRVSVSVTTGQQIIAPAMAGFLTSYPNINVQMELTNRRVDILEEGVDVVIRVGNLPDSGLVSRLLGKSYHQFFTTDTYLKQYGEPKDITELCDHPILMMGGKAGEPQTMTLQQGNVQETHTITPYCTVNDFSAIYQLAIGGVGIALLPHYMGKKEGVRRVLPDWQAPAVEFHALFPSHRGATPKLRVFLDFLKTLFEERMR